MAGFAVIDCETTGLDAATDRIVEVAVVRLDAAGEYEDSWVSLVNPGRRVDATFVHSIRDADVAQAPSFAGLAPVLARLLSGRAVVAHNVAFDAAFLEAEFARAAFCFPIPEEIRVCTMELSKIYLPFGRHSLPAAARRAGIETGAGHRALPDAETAAKLLQVYLRHEAEGLRYADAAQTRSGGTVHAASWLRALALAQSGLTRGSLEGPANATGGEASTSSSIRSAGYARA